MLAAYGEAALCGKPLTDEQWIGLYLNLPRQRVRLASAVAEGVVAGSSPQSLGEEWADAVALLEESVDLLHYQINADRQTARVRARLGFPSS